jgi:hemoglobin
MANSNADTDKGVGPAGDGANEQAIRACVRSFYAKAQNDALLAPVFAASIGDWEHHLERIQDFWSRHLLGTARYDGHPFAPHMQLPVEPEHFARWLELFEETARETLSAPLAGQAIERARHMSSCFQAGIFPITDRNGRPIRLVKPRGEK